MIRKFFSVMVVGCLITLGVATTGQAQLPPGTSVHASIPFDFIVRGRTLPAGTYELRRVSDTAETLIIRNVNDNHDLATFITEPVQSRQIQKHSELVFNRYGDSYFLSRIWDGGEQSGRALPTSSEERHLKSEISSNQPKPETVAVAIY